MGEETSSQTLPLNYSSTSDDIPLSQSLSRISPTTAASSPASSQTIPLSYTTAQDGDSAKSSLSVSGLSYASQPLPLSPNDDSESHQPSFSFDIKPSFSFSMPSQPSQASQASVPTILPDPFSAALKSSKEIEADPSSNFLTSEFLTALNDIATLLSQVALQLFLCTKHV